MNKFKLNPNGWTKILQVIWLFFLNIQYIALYGTSLRIALSLCSSKNVVNLNLVSACVRKYRHIPSSKYCSLTNISNIAFVGACIRAYRHIPTSKYCSLSNISNIALVGPCVRAYRLIPTSKSSSLTNILNMALVGKCVRPYTHVPTSNYISNCLCRVAEGRSQRRCWDTTCSTGVWCGSRGGKQLPRQTPDTTSLLLY